MRVFVFLPLCRLTTFYSPHDENTLISLFGKALDCINSLNNFEKKLKLRVISASLCKNLYSFHSINYTSCASMKLSHKILPRRHAITRWKQVMGSFIDSLMSRRLKVIDDWRTVVKVLTSTLHWFIWQSWVDSAEAADFFCARQNMTASGFIEPQTVELLTSIFGRAE